MNIKPEDYILAYWIASDTNNNNWYMMAWKNNGKWKCEYTFRYSKDSDPWSGKDEKNVYSLEIDSDMSEKDILKRMNALFGFIKIKYNYFNDHFLVKGDYFKFKKIASTKDYMHIKEQELKSDE